MRLTENESKFVRDLCSFNSDVERVQEEVKQQYGFDTQFDEEKGELRIVCNSVNESLNVARAKEFIESKIDNGMLTVTF